MLTRTKILIGPLLCLGIVALGYLIFRAEHYRRIIAEQSSLGFDPSKPDGGDLQGLACYWRIGRSEPTQTTPTLWLVICGARPVWVYLDSLHAKPPVTLERARKIGVALRFFGSLETINVQGAGNEGLELFMSVGHQPNLTKASSYRVPITDEINSALRGFPRLRELAICTSEYRARRFPYLPELESADFQGSPITLEGLAMIADSPRLRLIVVDGGELTEDGFRAIQKIRAEHPHLQGLEFEPPKQKILE